MNLRQAKWTPLALLMIVAAAILIFFGIASAAAGKPQQDPAAAQQSSIDQTQQTQQPQESQERQTLLIRQSQEEADTKSKGCLSCHTQTDSLTMHETNTVRIGCTDCHLGDANVFNTAKIGTSEYDAAKKKAHVQPRNKENEHRAAYPVRAYTKWLEESREFIQFVNPGDLRVVAHTCGRSGCHVQEVRNVRTSMMTHGAMLWGAALYNNGGYPLKNPHFGESYTEDGKPQRLLTWPPPIRTRSGKT